MGQSTLFQAINTLNKVQCQLVTYQYKYNIRNVVYVKVLCNKSDDI